MTLTAPEPQTHSYCPRSLADLLDLVHHIGASTDHHHVGEVLLRVSNELGPLHSSVDLCLDRFSVSDEQPIVNPAEETQRRTLPSRVVRDVMLADDVGHLELDG